jgi:alpha-galactosidase
MPTRLTASVPYMGWNTYYGLGINFTESHVRSVADFLISSGLAAAGYKIVWLDGGWTQGTNNRDGDGNLVPVAANFPSGMLSLTNYIHSKGLFAGIYTDSGTVGCVSQGGSEGHYVSDFDLFFNMWKFDAVKVDSCGLYNESLDPRTTFTNVLNAVRTATGADQLVNVCTFRAANDTWSWAPGIGAVSWRTSYDVGVQGSTSWADIIRNFTDNLHPTANTSGHYNDPDYLQFGQSCITDTECRSQFLLWSIMAAPLIIGSDPRNFSPSTISLLTNSEVLAINQDPACKQAANVSRATPAGTSVWSKHLSDGTLAVALFNGNASASDVAFTSADIGLTGSFSARDVVAGVDMGSFSSYSVNLPSHVVQLLRLASTGEGQSTSATLVAVIYASDTKILGRKIIPDNDAQFVRHQACVGESRLFISIDAPYDDQACNEAIAMAKAVVR